LNFKVGIPTCELILGQFKTFHFERLAYESDLIELTDA
jgi:hypothetical protein